MKKYIYVFRLKEGKNPYYPDYIEIEARCFGEAQIKLGKVIKDVASRELEAEEKALEKKLKSLKDGEYLETTLVSLTSYYKLEGVTVY